MQVFSIEVYDSNLNCIYHDNIDSVSYEFDYLSMKENKITVDLNDTIAKGNYIRITNDTYSYFGVVSTIDKSVNNMVIGYKPFTFLFTSNFIFDTSKQGTNTVLETYIKQVIESNYKNNSDTLQNIAILGSITTTSSTTNWGFNIKSDKEGMNRALIRLYDVLLTRAFNKYGVVVNAIPDFANRVVNLEIGKVDTNDLYIEAELPNILSKNIVIKNASDDINKAVMVNTSNYSNTINYYLHSDGTYNTTNSDRITPVISEYVPVDLQDGKTFSQCAQEQATNTFGAIEYSNLIELEVLNDDNLVKPLDIQIGQKVNVLYKGVSYPSILSGFNRNLTTLLTFGSIRLDLTKLIKTGGI